MKHNYKRITALAGMTALLVSMPVSVYAGQIRNTYTANLSNVLGSVDVSALKGNPVVKGSNIVVDSDTDDWDDITSRTADALLVLSCGSSGFIRLFKALFYV